MINEKEEDLLVSEEPNLVNHIVEYKDSKYFVDKLVKMRDPTTNVWLLSYLYRSLSDSEEYVREKLDFESKFSIVI